jgi:4-amino-4-deoxy-L-arabinose transferase-like glycosyltransferase
MYGALGLAVLTKSILGFGLPAAIIGLHALLSGRLREFFSGRLLMGSTVTAAIALPWHAAVARANPDFLGYYVIREHLLRFTGQRFPADEFLPLPLFLLLTVLWTFPWITLLPQAVGRSMGRLGFHGWRQFLAPGNFLRAIRFQSDADLLLILWVTVVLGVFSASHSRLEYYALPCIPAVALLVGKLWSDVLSGNGDAALSREDGSSSRPRQDGGAACCKEQPSPLQRSVTSALAVMAVLMGIAAAAALVLLGPAKESISQIITNAWPTGGWTGSPDQMATLERIRVPAMGAFAGAAVFSAGAWAAARRGNFKIACGLPAIMMAAFFMLVHWGFLAVEPFQSTRPVAEIVRTYAGPDDMVVFPEPHEYMWVGGITFYAGHPVHILKDPRFDGLASRRREPPDRFLDESEFLRLWGSSRRVLVVTEAEGNLEQMLAGLGDLKVLGRAGARVVLANR